MLPFTREVFLRVFEQYNAAVWPAQAAAYGLGLLVILIVWAGPVRGGDRFVAAALAASWLWVGIVYHMGHFATINWAAWAFGALFAVQALLLAWTGVVRGRIAFRFKPDRRGWTGLGLVVFSMAVYPLIGWLAGRGWPQAAMFGITPCPTTIFTLGMLLTTHRVPRHLLAIPVLWSIVGGTAAWLLTVPEDLALPLAAAAAVWLSSRRDRPQCSARELAVRRRRTGQETRRLGGRRRIR